MTLAADTRSTKPGRSLLRDLGSVLRAHGRRRPSVAEETPTTEDALVRALCHDMRSPLASLEAALGSIDSSPEHRAELLALARAQTAHLSSMLRTADATGGATRGHLAPRLLADVVITALDASGLARARLALEFRGDAADVRVGDARVQRILTNLLENAHRHGGGAAVSLVVVRRAGWVDLALTQDGVPPGRVVGHLRTPQPPVDLSGLGLWSVHRQTRELGGHVLWAVDGGAFTLTIALPDR